MTAFANSELEADSLTLVCELRSVNHRYCDISVRLPERLRFAEADIRNTLAAKLKRGKIECAVSFSKQTASQSLVVNQQAVLELLAATAQIEGLMTEPRRFSAIDVLMFPGVQHQAEMERDTLKQHIDNVLELALQMLWDVRGREGQQLALLIEERCQKIVQLTQAAELRMPEVLAQMRCKLKARVMELVAEPNFDRLEQELVLLAQKLDVAEELDRLKTHVAEVLLALKQAEPVGRRLDFLMQEMNREANTLGSKSADKEMTQISIDLKVLIEQMREQIQNIE